ncbi:efflux RND transporter permease subunit [Klebsiella pneumoniae subsp. pneumoniae]|nr:efflux RND transporter permease subunit [Klebsiella pneumoniae subsp. pneumoniae]
MNALNITTDDVAQALREQNVQGAAGQVGTPPVFNGQQQTLTINGLGRLNEAASFGEIILRRGAQGSWCASPTWRPLSWAPAATAPAPS